MSFRALRDGEIVVPAIVSNREPVSCDICGDTMYARGGEERARHFYHIDDNADKACPSTAQGESSTHARCVALAVAALQNKFGSQATRCFAEKEIDVSASGSGNRIRRADALVEFDGINPFFGKGLIIEVQHRHHEKSIRTTTHDYLSTKYSVVWLSSEDFGDEKLDYSVVNKAFTSEDREGYSVRNCSPMKFIDCESYHYSGEHSWGTVPEYVLTCEEEYEICTSRPCTLRRQYDEKIGEYIYNPESITTPDLPLKVLQDAIVGDFWRGIKQPLTERYREAVLEKSLADRPEIDKCPGPKGFHEWESPKSLWEGAAKVELRGCQHCSVHLLTDLRGRGTERDDILFTKEPDPEWYLLSLKKDPRQCQHPNREEGHWYDFCQSCGVSNPDKY